MGYILVGSLTRLKTLVYKINGAEYRKFYMKHNGELNPGVVPTSPRTPQRKLSKKVVYTRFSQQFFNVVCDGLYSGFEICWLR